MEVGQCQCSKTYSWQIHAVQGNHGFQTANYKKGFSAKMKPTEKEKRKVSKHTGMPPRINFGGLNIACTRH